MLPLEIHLMTLKLSQYFQFTIQFSILSHLCHCDSDQTLSSQQCLLQLPGDFQPLAAAPLWKHGWAGVLWVPLAACRLISTLKFVLVTETAKHLSANRGTDDFAATVIIIKVSFQLSPAAAFPRYKARTLLEAGGHHTIYLELSEGLTGRIKAFRATKGQILPQVSWISVLVSVPCYWLRLGLCCGSARRAGLSLPRQLLLQPRMPPPLYSWLGSMSSVSGDNKTTRS